MAITVEPGCYFNPCLLQPALKDTEQATFLVKERVLSLMVCWLARFQARLGSSSSACTCLPVAPDQYLPYIF